MFVSHKYKLLFFEVPRTGSRAITQALTQLDPHSPTAIVRAVKKNLFNYHVYDQKLVDKHSDYALIAVHRNPYHRIRSHYKYRKQYGNPDELKDFSFTDYINWVCDGELPYKIGPAMIDRPITELIDCEQVDHFLDFERLNQDWNALGHSLKVNLPDLPRINYSATQYDFECTYSKELAHKVATRFASDFAFFAYRANYFTE